MSPHTLLATPEAAPRVGADAVDGPTAPITTITTRRRTNSGLRPIADGSPVAPRTAGLRNTAERLAAIPKPVAQPPVTGPDQRGSMAPIVGMRWVVSLWVVLLHTSFGAVAADVSARYIAEGGASAVLGYALAALGRVAAFAFAGTSIFLVLGGYALSIGTLDRHDGSMRRSATSLWRSRLLRFVPLLVLTQAMRIPQFLMAHGDRPWSDVFTSIGVNLLGQQAWFPSYVWDLNDPSWTMTVLLSCWAVFPFVAPRLATLRPRTALWALLGCVAFSLVVASTVLMLHGESNADHTATDYWLSWLHTFPLVRIPEFMAGVLLARVHRAYGAWIAPRASLILSLGLGALVVGCAVNTVVVPYVLMHNGLVVPIACLLFVGFAECGAALHAGRTSHLNRVAVACTTYLTRPRFQRIGAAGFSLYLLHAVPLAALIVGRNWVAHRPLLFSGRPMASSAWELVLMLAYVAALGAISVVVHERCVDPVTKWLGARLRFWREDQAAAARADQAPPTTPNIRLVA